MDLFVLNYENDTNWLVFCSKIILLHMIKICNYTFELYIILK